jgi:predicted dithiol-disulfide oxidoreductase (DUF899 family)
MNHAVVSREEWLAARRRLLEQEKSLTRAREALAAERRALPWVKVEKPYAFDTVEGRRSLAQLFDGRSQLIVQHVMFDPSWEDACKSCSFWVDGLDPMAAHLAQRDVTAVAVSRAPLDKLQAFRRRMGWTLTWVSSAPSDFNYDFGVSFTPEAQAKGEISYNYGPRQPMGELPGISVFCRGADGQVFHTYSCYARGLDMMNAAYQYLDLVPKGRDEAGLPFTMAWVKLHDRY